MTYPSYHNTPGQLSYLIDQTSCYGSPSQFLPSTTCALPESGQFLSQRGVQHLAALTTTYHSPSNRGSYRTNSVLSAELRHGLFQNSLSQVITPSSMATHSDNDHHPQEIVGRFFGHSVNSSLEPFLRFGQTSHIRSLLKSTLVAWYCGGVCPPWLSVFGLEVSFSEMRI